MEKISARPLKYLKLRTDTKAQGKRGQERWRGQRRDGDERRGQGVVHEVEHEGERTREDVMKGVCRTRPRNRQVQDRKCKRN